MAERHKKVDEEHLEAIWMLLEKNDDIRGAVPSEKLKRLYPDLYSPEAVDRLIGDDLLSEHSEQLAFTDKGFAKSRQLIRAHRLAERLLNDVLGIDDYEVGACEFEHIIDTNLINGICTLLGHPDRCPDGLPIPSGACCRKQNRQQPNPTVTVSEMRSGDAGRVASVHMDDDTRLHVLENLQIRPGSLLKVHQAAPTIVIDCEGSVVAIDDEIAENIHVWPSNKPDDQEMETQKPRRRREGRFRHKNRRRDH